MHLSALVLSHILFTRVAEDLWSACCVPGIMLGAGDTAKGRVCDAAASGSGIPVVDWGDTGGYGTRGREDLASRYADTGPVLFIL